MRSNGPLIVSLSLFFKLSLKNATIMEQSQILTVYCSRKKLDVADESMSLYTI